MLLSQRKDIGKKMPFVKVDEPRTEYIRIRLTVRERNRLEQNMKAAGFNKMSEYIRSIAVGKVPKLKKV
jgi:hypothetical protein